jgi:hypothetical protein
MEREHADTLSRRDFLKRIRTAAGIGAAVSIIDLPVEVTLNIGVENYTHFEAGNAAIREERERACLATEDPEACLSEYKFTNRQKFETVVIAPPLEEIIFRGVPSAFCKNESSDDLNHLVVGTGNRGLTRREVIFGAVTSVIFGALHNVTGDGFDTSTIPVSQTFGGGFYWYLQRRFGIISNIASHTAFNGTVVAITEVAE